MRCKAVGAHLPRLGYTSLLMPPLTRQRTLESIRSYWSDNGFVGATVSLHAMAKPLMRLMYHMQATAFTERNRDTPTSKEGLDIYLGYLECKYVYGKTKALILRDLFERLMSADAVAISVAQYMATDSRLAYELLGSSDSGVREWACFVLGYATWKTGVSLPVWLCERITELLSDLDINVRRNSVDSLFYIVESAAGNQAVLNAGVLAYLPQLLDSTDFDTRSSTLELIWLLADQESVAMEILQIIPCEQLVVFCDVGRPECTDAVCVLAVLSNWFDGAEAVLAAGALKYVPGLLDSADEDARIETCIMLANFAFYEILSLAEWPPTIPRQLASLLRYFLHFYRARSPVEGATRDKSTNVRRYSIHALCHISLCEGGNRAVLDANVLDYVETLMDSNDYDSQKWTCLLLGNLASSTHPTPNA
ncbi:armadillo-type protein [Mycena vitilis]|nr:armadillo-type protein [Mycena vitilis]